MRKCRRSGVSNLPRNLPDGLNNAGFRVESRFQVNSATACCQFAETEERRKNNPARETWRIGCEPTLVLDEKVFSCGRGSSGRLAVLLGGFNMQESHGKGFRPCDGESGTTPCGNGAGVKIARETHSGGDRFARITRDQKSTRSVHTQ